MKELKNLFQGRINRHQWFLGNILAIVALFFVGLIQFFILPAVFDSSEIILALVMSLGLFAWGILFIIGVGLNVRRLHDTGHSGWTILWNLIPFVSIFMFFYLLIKLGVVVNNEYGGTPVRRNILDVVFNK